MTILLGCLGLLLVIVVAVAIQATFLHLAASVTNLYSSFSTACKAVVIYIGIIILLNLAGFSIWSPSEGAPLSDEILSLLAMSLLIELVVGTIAVMIAYSVPVGRALMTYLLSQVFLLLACGLIFALLWLAGGDDFERGVREGLATIPWSGTSHGSSEDAVPLLEPVEPEEIGNALDISLDSAERYVGRRVRVVHGTHAETVGILVKVSLDSLTIRMTITGGEIDIPIRKTKIRTLQLLAPD